MKFGKPSNQRCRTRIPERIPIVDFILFYFTRLFLCLLLFLPVLLLCRNPMFESPSICTCFVKGYYFYVIQYQKPIRVSAIFVSGKFQRESDPRSNWTSQCFWEKPIAVGAGLEACK